MSNCNHDHDHDHDHNHNHDHGHSHDEHEKEGVEKGDSLYAYIDSTKVRGLNAKHEAHVVYPFKPYHERRDKEKYLDSNEDDPELILFVPFTEAVSIKSISISGGEEGTHPKAIKIFANRDDIDFSNASELPETQRVELAEDFNAEIDYPLSARKFQGVSNISIFVENSYQGDSTRIYYIGLKGESKKWRHGVVDCVYEARAQPWDHKVADKTGSLI